MKKDRIPAWRTYLKWILGFVLVQALLANISAAIYAYRFTHYAEGPPPPPAHQNVLVKTWKLFVGPKFYRDTTEGQPSFPVTEVTFATAEGIPLRAWYSGQEGARGCVLLFHGNSANKGYLKDEAALFRSWGYNVLLTDLRGHGKSGGHETSLGVRETEEVGRALAFARQKGNEKIVLYGMSMGAGICIKSVSEGLVRPAGLIAEMPFGTLRNHFRARARVLNFPSEPFATLVTLWVGVEQGYNAFRHDVGRYAAKAECPVLVQWGDNDAFVSRDEVERVYAAFPSRHKKLVIYPGAGHESLLQADPNRWQSEVRAFLDAL